MVSNGRQPCMRGIDSEQAGWDVRSTSHLQTGMAFTPIPWLCCLSVTVVSSICVHRSDRHAPANFYWSPQHKQQQQQQCHPWRPDATTLPLPLPSTPCSIPPSLPTNCRAVKAHYPAPIIIWYHPEMYHCVSSLHVGVMRFVLMFLYFCQQTVCEFLIEVLVLFLWRLVSTLHSRAHRCPGHLQLVKNFTSLQLYT